MTEARQEGCFVHSKFDSIPGMMRFSHEAMATTFEVFVVHEDEGYARQAAATAFKEVDRLEGELSRFVENSEVSRINNLTADQPLTIGLDTFECLQLSMRISAETDRAFDITVGSLSRCWRNDNGTPRVPSPEKLNRARRHSWIDLLELDETEHTVRLVTSPVEIDLGGIGKGYAVDKMAEFLREWSVDTALISGGYSSVLALDAPSETNGWPLALCNPANRKQILARPYLQNRALGGSGLKKGQHIIDPRTGRPVEGKLAAWASAPNAATADALSTAFMVMSPGQIKQYCLYHPNILAVIMLHDQTGQTTHHEILHFGQWKQDELIR